MMLEQSDIHMPHTHMHTHTHTHSESRHRPYYFPTIESQNVS